MDTSVGVTDRERVTGAPEYDLETPFLDKYQPEKNGELLDRPQLTSSVWQQLETPFSSQLEMESIEGENPQAQLYAQLLAELIQIHK